MKLNDMVSKYGLAGATCVPHKNVRDEDNILAESIISYRNNVINQARATDESEVINNSSQAHAAVIIAAIFNTAQDTVDILTGFLNGRVYGREEVVDAVLGFLHRGGQLRVLLDQVGLADMADLENPLLCAIHDKNLDDQVEFKTIDVDKIDRFHLIVADGKHYRFESDKRKPSALAQFNQEERGEILSGIFDDLWDSAANQLRVEPLPPEAQDLVRTAA